MSSLWLRIQLSLNVPLTFVMELVVVTTKNVCLLSTLFKLFYINFKCNNWNFVGYNVLTVSEYVNLN